MVNCGDPWGESSMNTKDSALDDCGYGQIIEDLGKIVPNIVISVLFSYLIVKAINKSDCSGLMVSS